MESPLLSKTVTFRAGFVSMPVRTSFVANRFQIGGKWMNLYDLENKIIRVYGDARVHAAINCAPQLPYPRQSRIQSSGFE